MSADITPFIADAQRLEKETGIPASITLGQIILESSGSYSGGLSGLAAQAKNLFGIKGSGTAGSISMPTHEVINGNNRIINSSFRAYNSFYDSLVDHAKLLSNPRYAKYLNNAKSVNDYAVGIKKGGYATDPNYSSKLLGIISSKNLHQYDSGNYSFHPLSGSSSSSSSDSSNAATADNGGLAQSLFSGVVHTILLLGLLILGIIFFMKSFDIPIGTPQKLVMNALTK